MTVRKCLSGMVAARLLGLCWFRFPDCCAPTLSSLGRPAGREESPFPLGLLPFPGGGGGKKKKKGEPVASVYSHSSNSGSYAEMRRRCAHAPAPRSPLIGPQRADGGGSPQLAFSGGVSGRDKRKTLQARVPNEPSTVEKSDPTHTLPRGRFKRGMARVRALFLLRKGGRGVGYASCSGQLLGSTLARGAASMDFPTPRRALSGLHRHGPSGVRAAAFFGKRAAPPARLVF